MVDIRNCVAALAMAALMAQPVAAGPLSSPRLLPGKSVTVLETGVTMDKEVPAPAGVLMACNGRCFIEAQGVQLMGADKTVFAVREDQDAFHVMVETGNISFAMRADAKPLEFTTPFDAFQAKPALIPASSDAVIRGTLEVTESRAVLSMTEGSLELVNADGQKLLKAGSSIVLARGLGLSEADTELLSGLAVATATLGIIGASIVAVAGGGDEDGDGSKTSSKGVGKDVSPK